MQCIAQRLRSERRSMAGARGEKAAEARRTQGPANRAKVAKAVATPICVTGPAF
jgi:hypothetical protein